MRLKITFTAAKIRLPIAYQQVLQGVIYKVFSGSDYGTFLHDEGYKVDDKTFKFFNFSNLHGNYSIKKDMIEFCSLRPCLFQAEPVQNHLQIKQETDPKRVRSVIWRIWFFCPCCRWSLQSRLAVCPPVFCRGSHTNR